MRTSIGVAMLICVAILGTAQAQIESGTQVDHNVLLIIADDIGVDVLAKYDELSLGTCSEDMSEACNSDSDCAFCSGNSNACVTDDNCPSGTCSVSGDPCHTNFDCPSPIMETCDGGESCEGSCVQYATTPTLDALANQGILFRNAWSDPACEPTRRGIERGLYSFRPGPPPGQEQKTIAEYLRDDAGYRTAAFGKFGGTGGGTPDQHGYDDYYVDLAAAPHSYCLWERSVLGSSACSNNYATMENVDDVITWLSSSQQQGQDWFVMLAFPAAHSAANGSYHNPPDGLSCAHQANPDCNCSDDQQTGGTCSPDLLGCADTDRECYLQMVETMDSEIDRLLGATDGGGGPIVDLEKTTIIFVSDNGTPNNVISPFYETKSGKTSLYEGGINVPLIIWPKGGLAPTSPPRESTALVNTTDIFATVLDLAQLPVPSGIDSVSLKPIIDAPLADIQLRPYAFAEGSLGAQGSAIRNEHFKLIVFDGGGEELYDLDAGGDIAANELLAGGLDAFQACNYERLKVGLQRIDEEPMFPQPDSFCDRLSSECDTAPAADYDGDCVSDACDNCATVCNSDQNTLPENDYGACQCPQQKSCNNGCSPDPASCSYSSTNEYECWVDTNLVECDPYEELFIKTCACEGPPSPPWGGPVEPMNCGESVTLHCLAP